MAPNSRSLTHNGHRLLDHQQSQEDVNPTTCTATSCTVTTTTTNSGGDDDDKKPAAAAAAALNNSSSSTKSAATRRHSDNDEEQQQQQQPSPSNNHPDEQQKQQKKNTINRPLSYYIPKQLINYVRPYHGDFCYTLHFHPVILSQLMVEGFLPIATRLSTEGGQGQKEQILLLPKLHNIRCVIYPLSNLHVSKNIRKQKCKKFAISINENFDQVVQACRQQHGNNCWLYPPLVRAFTQMHNQPGGYATQIRLPDNSTASKNTNTTTANGQKNNGQTKQQNNNNNKNNLLQTCIVHVYSIEVWNIETGQLAAGELGYSVGSTYTSLTGFSNESSAGTVQLVTLGKLLSACGFTMWDLGMSMPYKTSLGAHGMNRHEFVTHVKQHRNIMMNQENNIILSLANEEDGNHRRKNCREIIDPDGAAAAAAAVHPHPKSPPPPHKRAKKKQQQDE